MSFPILIGSVPDQALRVSSPSKKCTYFLNLPRRSRGRNLSGSSLWSPSMHLISTTTIVARCFVVNDQLKAKAEIHFTPQELYPFNTIRKLQDSASTMCLWRVCASGNKIETSAQRGLECDKNITTGPRTQRQKHTYYITFKSAPSYLRTRLLRESS